MKPWTIAMCGDGPYLITNFKNSKKLGNTILRDMPHSGHLSTSFNPANDTKVDTLIRVKSLTTVLVLVTWLIFMIF